MSWRVLERRKWKVPKRIFIVFFPFFLYIYESWIEWMGKERKGKRSSRLSTLAGTLTLLFFFLFFEYSVTCTPYWARRREFSSYFFDTSRIFPIIFFLWNFKLRLTSIDERATTRLLMGEWKWWKSTKVLKPRFPLLSIKAITKWKVWLQGEEGEGKLKMSIENFQCEISYWFFEGW